MVCLCEEWGPVGYGVFRCHSFDSKSVLFKSPLGDLKGSHCVTGIARGSLLYNGAAMAVKHLLAVVLRHWEGRTMGGAV